MLGVMMDTLSANDLEFDGPAVYRIRCTWRAPRESVQPAGRHGHHRVQCGYGSCVTSLVGELSDQADLAGVFNTLYGLHLPVLSVECLNATP